MIQARSLPSGALSCTPSPLLWISRTPSWLRALSASGLIRPVFARLGCQVGPLLFRAVLSQRAPACDPGENPTFVPDLECCLLPSPCHEKLGSPKHLSADNLSRLLRSLLLRPAGLLPSFARAFDTPPSSVGSLLPVAVCYRALWHLPGQDLHLLEQRVFQHAPWGDCSGTRAAVWEIGKSGNFVIW